MTKKIIFCIFIKNLYFVLYKKWKIQKFIIFVKYFLNFVNQIKLHFHHYFFPEPSLAPPSCYLNATLTASSKTSLRPSCVKALHSTYLQPYFDITFLAFNNKIIKSKNTKAVFTYIGLSSSSSLRSVLFPANKTGTPGLYYFNSDHH